MTHQGISLFIGTFEIKSGIRISIEFRTLERMGEACGIINAVFGWILRIDPAGARG